MLTALMMWYRSVTRNGTLPVELVYVTVLRRAQQHSLFP